MQRYYCSHWYFSYTDEQFFFICVIIISMHRSFSLCRHFWPWEPCSFRRLNRTRKKAPRERRRTLIWMDMESKALRENSKATKMELTWWSILVTLLRLLGCFHWCNIFQRINLQYPSFTSIISQKSINQSILTWSIGVIFFPQMLWMAFVVSAMSLTKYTSCGEQDRWLSCLLVFDPIKAVLLWL